jgi:hypothetical protein
MWSQFTLERQALERHQAQLHETAHDRLVDQSASPVAPTMLMTICAAVAGLPVLTLVSASWASTFVTHIHSAAIAA